MIEYSQSLNILHKRYKVGNDVIKQVNQIGYSDYFNPGIFLL